jgi:protein-disulfide isomerase
MENKNSNFLAMSIVAAAVILGGSLIYSAGLKDASNINQQANVGGAAENEASLDIPEISNSVVLGDKDAPVTLFVFGDFQCSYCVKFFKDTEPLIVKNYVDTGKVKMVHKDLSFLGDASVDAAMAAKCAKDQSKYWQYHDALYEAKSEEINSGTSGAFTRANFGKIASNLGMNSEKFLDCFDNKKYADEIREDSEEASRVMPQISTPTIFVNAAMIQGAYPYANFETAIEAALAEKQ